MKFSRVVKVAAVLAAAGMVITGCSSAGDGGTSSSKNAKPQQTVKVLMNYYAQAEQGGYWDAGENQYSKADGVTYDVVPGGPGIQTIPQVASGSYQFGIGNADEVLIARKSGLPVVTVMSVYDTNLFVMISHKSANITSFADLNGHQVAHRPAPYFEYLKKKFNLNKIQEVNFTGSIANFKVNPNLVQQGFATSDVFQMGQNNIPVNVLSVAKDGGYNPYGLVLFTTEKYIKQNPDAVKAVVAASVKGWENFLKDPADAKKAIFASNKDADDATFAASWKTITEGDYIGKPVGNMTKERWNDLGAQLESIGELPKGFDVASAWTDKYLPKQ